MKVNSRDTPRVAIPKTLRADIPVRWVVLGFLASIPLYAMPWFEASQQRWLAVGLLRPLFLAAVTVLLLRRIRKLHMAQEMRFWNRLGFAYGCWTALELMGWLVPADALWQRFARELLFATHYATLVLAFDSAPHKRLRAEGPIDGTRTRQILLVVAVAAFFLYVVLLPALFTRPTLADLRPPLVFRGLLDIALIVQLLVLRRDARSPRWKALYGLLGWVLTMTLANHGWQLAAASGWELPQGVGLALANLPFPILAVAVGLRHYPFSPMLELTTRPDDSPLDEPSEAGLQTLFLALALPTVHGVLYAFDALSLASRGAREGLIALWLPAIAILAMRQHWSVRRHNRLLLERRARLSSTLKASQASLRLMAQRQKTAEELRQAEERFSTFFRMSPAAFLISRLDDGQVVEVNDHLARLLRRPRHELLDSQLDDLALWWSTDQGHDILATVRRHATIDRLRCDIRPARGPRRTVLLSASSIELLGAPCLLAVMRDITHLRQSEDLLEERRVWLERLARFSSEST